jgi:hypothetical protein
MVLNTRSVSDNGLPTMSRLVSDYRNVPLFDVRENWTLLGN